MRLADKLLRAYFKKKRKHNETTSRPVMRRGGTLPRPTMGIMRLREPAGF